MKRHVYEVIYIGAGPATIFSVLIHPIKNSLILEKGNSIVKRSRKEMLSGFAGCGCWSDSKLVANPAVGGDLNTIKEFDFDKYADEILELYNYFAVSKRFDWMSIDKYELDSSKLKLLKSRVCHIGTDNSAIIFSNIERHIKYKGTAIQFNTEAQNIQRMDGFWKVQCNKGIYYTNKIVLATGKHDKLLEGLIKKLNLDTQTNKIQIGVRVEAPIKPFQELVDKFYDFKIVKQLDNNEGRLRSFCCNSGAAHVAVEKSEDFISANGHAYKNKLSNGLVNFGIICELKTNIEQDKQDQITMARAVNYNTNKLLAQNIEDFLNNVESKKLNCKTTVDKTDYRLDDLNLFFPRIIVNYLKEYFIELFKCIDSDIVGHFFAPEIKLVSPKVKTNKDFSIYPGIYIIGDVGVTRSIIQSGISGILLGEVLDGKR